MAYIQYLRLRRALLWYGGVIGGLVLLLIVFATSNSDIRHGDAQMHGSLGSSALLGGAFYCATIFATIVATSLNRFSVNADFAWTKPISRVRLGALLMACDVGAIVVAVAVAAILFAIAILYFVAIAQVHGQVLAFDSPTLENVALGMGVAFMWFGMLQGFTAWYRGGGGLACGLSWGIFVVLIGLSALPHGPFRDVVMALNHVNPLAYLGSTQVTTSGDTLSTAHTSLFNYSAWQRGLIAWGIGFIGCALALLGWKRLEI